MLEPTSPVLTAFSLIALAVGLGLTARAIDRVRNPVVAKVPCPPHDWKKTPEVPGALQVLACTKCLNTPDGVNPWGQKKGD